jgi:tRNA-specific 2-thiouridylase
MIQSIRKRFLHIASDVVHGEVERAQQYVVDSVRKSMMLQKGKHDGDMSNVRVAVGVSGGVDSSVAAHVAKSVGLDVVGVFMRNWDESDEVGGSMCTYTQDRKDAQAACDALKIPFVEVDFVKEYWNFVFEEFLADLQRGLTPNPDVLCNSQIKFKKFVEFCTSRLGADLVATGHYARTTSSVVEPSQVLLQRAVDDSKDQSYFLCQVSQQALQQALFPLGTFSSKTVVRSVAHSLGLATAEKKESMGICFVGKRPFAEFVKPYLQSLKQGKIVDVDTKKIVGKHDGTALYTIGQRPGIGGAKERVFTIAKDEASGTVYVGVGANHPGLFSHWVTAPAFHFISSLRPPVTCRYQVRYRQTPGNCRITLHEQSSVTAHFALPQRAATRGQWLVLYDEMGVCYGGGKVMKVGPSLLEQGLPAPAEFAT